MGAPIAAWLALEGIAATVAAAGINMAAAVAVSFGLNELLGPDAPAMDLEAGSHLKARRTTAAHVRLIYGTCRVAPNQTYIASAGDDLKYLHIICALGEGPLTGLVDAAADGDTDSTTSPNAKVFLDEKHFSDYDSLIYWEFFTGTSIQTVCSTLNLELTEWTDTQRNTAYLYMRLEYDREKYNSLPNITAIVRGLQVDDPVDHVTAYSENAALIAYDLLTRPASRGGFGIDTNFKNLCQDPHFSKTTAAADTDYWTDLDGSGLYWTATGGYGGGPGLAFVQNGAAGQRYTYFATNGNYTELPVKNGCQLYFKFRYYATADYNGDYILGGARILDAAGSTVEWVTVLSETSYTTGAWTTVEGWATVTAATAVKLRPFITGVYHATAGTVYIDDVYFSILNPNESQTRRIDVNYIEDSRDYCTTKGWTFNAPLEGNKHVSDHLDLILGHFRGALVRSAGTFQMLYRDLNDEAVQMSFDESDIVTAGNVSSLRISAGDGATAKYNSIRARWLNPTGDGNGAGSYQLADYIYSDSAAIVADGIENQATVDLPGLTDLAAVQKMCSYLLERFRYNKTISVTLGTKALGLRPHELIQITASAYGWTNKKFRIIEKSDNQDLTVSISAIEEDIGLYDDTYDTAGLSWYDTTLPNVLAAPPSVINVSHTEQTYIERGRTLTRWKIDFEGPDRAVYPFWDYAEIWLSIGGTSDYRFMTKSENNYVLDPVNEGETYNIKIRSVSTAGLKENFSTCHLVSQQIVGKTGTPSNLSAMTAAAAGDAVSIYANPVTDPDIAGYEVRLGAAWEGGLFMSLNVNPSLRLIGVRPGTHTFWMTPKDKSDPARYGDTPVSANVTVYIPPGYTSFSTWAWDFNSGTHSNTEHTTKDFGAGSEDALKCSHTGGVLNGTFSSPTKDLGSIQNVRVWGDFRTVFESVDTTWNGVMPSPDTWDDINISTESWDEIFQPSAAGQLQATLYYSTDGSNWNTIDFFEILAAEVRARYLKIDVTITDPNDNANLYLAELNMKAYTGPQT